MIHFAWNYANWIIAVWDQSAKIHRIKQTVYKVMQLTAQDG